MQSLSIMVASSALLLGTGGLLPAEASTRETTDVLVSQAALVQATTLRDEPLYLNQDEVYSYDLSTISSGTIDGVYVPAGATIVGQFEPAEDGLRYRAKAAIVNGRTHDISAASDVLQAVKDPRDTGAGSVAEDAGIGAAAGTILGEVLGEAGAGEIIGGAVAGGVVGNVTADNVVVVEPREQIPLYSR